jgi:transcriptional regulator with XRE-family HTH domain
MTEHPGLFAAVDALLAHAEGLESLPPPAERVRLRTAAGLTVEEVARALKVRPATLRSWEEGTGQPKPEKLEPYRRLLEGLADRFAGPARAAADPQTPPEPSAAESAPAPARADGASAAPVSGFAESAPALAPAPAAPTPAPAPAPTSTPAAPAAGGAARTGPARPPARTASTGESATRRLAPRRAAGTAPQVAGEHYPHGPLLVLDGDGAAYGAGGIVLDCLAATIPELVEWTLAEAGIGAGRLHRHGRDADPLVVLTREAAVRLGLPARLEGFEARRGLRLPDDHPVVRQIAKARWKLTQRGFGPWPRIYRPAQGGRRACVQLAVVAWDALDTRAWGDAADLPAPELAHVLGTYAARVLTPRGSSAVSGLELMTALRPPTKPVRGQDGATWVSAPNPGALTVPVDPAPPEAPVEHPVAQDWQARGGTFLDEEAYQWVRPMESLSDEECLQPWAVGLDINTAFLAAASRLTVGTGEPVHRVRPVFDKKTPGCWLVDLSHVDADPRLPSPFTPSGERPEGPAWYATPTVAYAQELGYDVAPLEAYVRLESGAYLDPWHDRLRDAYLATMADLGVAAGTGAGERAYLAAMEHHKQADEGMAMVLSAIKATVKGGIGKLRERPQGRHYRDGERWPALDRPTWRPDIRAAVIAKARTNMHRKIVKTSAATGRYPLAVLSDCVVYCSPGPSPLDFLPLTDDGQVLPGSFRLGASPGMAKVEGAQPMVWAVELMDQGLNPARHVKGGDAVLDEGE